MTEEKKICIQCERSDEQTPLIALVFKGEAKYICSQYLPVLIHKTHLLVDKLPGIDISTNG